MRRQAIRRVTRFCLLALSWILASASSSTAGEIAITFDDLPYLTPSKVTPDQGLAQVRAITETLARHDIEAVGFAVGGMITDETRPALDAFAKAGHVIGNHSWTHSDYGDQWLWQFRRETRRTDKMLQPWMGQQKFYRFPYLREGRNARAQHRAHKILKNLGYRNARVTIDNQEWKYNAAYVAALDTGNRTEAARIASDYLAHMQERTRYYETLAQDAFGREIKHVLLLHLNQINADHLGALIDWYVADGWRFIPLDEALSDPVYTLPDKAIGPWGLGHLERVLGLESE